MDFTFSVENLSYGSIKPNSSISFSFGRQLRLYDGVDAIVFDANLSYSEGVVDDPQSLGQDEPKSPFGFAIYCSQCLCKWTFM